MSKKIGDATIEEIKQGFSFDKNSGIYSCLFCDRVCEEGVIYNEDDSLVDAKKAIKRHIENVHGSVFDMLLEADKKNNGLTKTQKDYLKGFYNGISDRDIAKETNTTTSTVRYQRFNFREKAKQAKMMVVIAELLEEKLLQTDYKFPEIHASATMVDERYMTTGIEADKVIKTFFISLTPLKLKTFSTKEKNKLVILKVIAKQFNFAKRYSEKQVNEILKGIYYDYGTIRRYLIEYGFMDRTTDGGEYWLKG